MALSRRASRSLHAVAAAAGALIALPAVALAHPVTAPAGHLSGLPAGARARGALAPDAIVSATVALRPRDPRGLAAAAAGVSEPGSPSYRHDLTVAQFARRFAPSAAARAEVRIALRRRGIDVGAMSPNGLDITVRAPARVADRAFATRIEDVVLRDGRHVTAPTATPRLAGAAGALVQGVIGLRAAAPSAAVVIRTPRGASRSAGRDRGGARADLLARASAPSAGAADCPGARAAAAQGGLLPGAIAARYGIANYLAAGDEGQGTTIALYELEPFSSADVAAYQACMGTDATVETEAVDGGAGAGPGSGEAASDVEDLIGLAPRATIRVYEGPQSADGAYATYAAIVSDDAAQVVSTSWGLCEADLGPSAAQAEDVLFQEAAVQGQTVLAAAGDSGSDDCGSGTPAVDDPASQPWVTGVGGTSARGASDAVWNDGSGAGGGGVSTFWARPSWQTGALAQSGTSCGAAATSCREVPDLSADADPATGYVIDYRGGWRIVGGTSVAAPTVAALTALADDSPACAGRPLGLLAPLLYAHASDLADVTSGTNAFDGVPGFAAGPGYDMASGLGTPTAALGPALCGDALSLTAPAAQSWTVGRAVSLGLRAVSARGAAIAYAASGLPAGLSIDRASGRIAGTPSVPGRGTITVTAVDADGAQAAVTFPVTVLAASAPTGAGTHGPHRHRLRHRRAADHRSPRRTGAHRTSGAHRRGAAHRRPSGARRLASRSEPAGSRGRRTRPRRRR